MAIIQLHKRTALEIALACFSRQDPESLQVQTLLFETLAHYNYKIT
jgi:hypothetical protein